MREAHVKELVELLQLERLEDNLFRGQSRDIGTRFVFGGQVLGQALSAAQQTVDPSREAHSLHAYFLRAGDIDAPIVYSVERARDGGSASPSSTGRFPSRCRKRASSTRWRCPRFPRRKMWNRCARCRPTNWPSCR